MSTGAGKLYHEMTPAERLVDRIAKNRSIDERAAIALKSGVKTADKKSAAKASRTVLDQFQQIKRTQGIDAAAEFVRERQK
jgi:hypothetical protein